jgi:hypothetical protein
VCPSSAAAETGVPRRPFATILSSSAPVVRRWIAPSASTQNVKPPASAHAGRRMRSSSGAGGDAADAAADDVAAGDADGAASADDAAADDAGDVAAGDADGAAASADDRGGGRFGQQRRGALFCRLRELRRLPRGRAQPVRREGEEASRAWPDHHRRRRGEAHRTADHMAVAGARAHSAGRRRGVARRGLLSCRRGAGACRRARRSAQRGDDLRCRGGACGVAARP